METPPITPGPVEPRRNNTTMIIAAVVVVLLCCCCVGLGLLWQYGDALLQYLQIQL